MHGALKIASWNVNSVKVREPHIIRFLEAHRPDCLCLQELKTVSDGFPRDAFLSLGYHAEVLGQKTYNGVAVLSRLPMQVVRTGLGVESLDHEARSLTVNLSGVEITSIYVPNGGEVDGPKWEGKLQFLDRLIALCREQITAEKPFVVCGDFNIAPEDRDVYNPKGWINTVLTAESVRERYRKLIELGMVDTFRTKYAEGGHYSWWDYRRSSYESDRGLRIDFCLASPAIKSSISDAGIIRETRGWERPSDHAPIFVSLTE